MSIYLCDLCGNMKDDDHDPCVEHPTKEAEYCCEDCRSEYDESMENERGDYLMGLEKDK